MVYHQEKNDLKLFIGVHIQLFLQVFFQIGKKVKNVFFEDFEV